MLLQTKHRKFFILKQHKQQAMKNPRKIAGAIFFVAITQFAIALIIAPTFHPDYSLSKYYLSDLGIGPYSLIFNLSAFTLGILLLLGAYLLRQQATLKPVNNLLFLMSFAVMAVGVFTKDYTIAHGIVASVAFLLSAVAAFKSVKILKVAPAIVSLVLGATTFCALALFSIGMVKSGSLTSTVAYDSVFYLGLGPGGMESMIVAPSLIWLALFSICLIRERGFK
jgi:hypothetical membrane protein